MSNALIDYDNVTVAELQKRFPELKKYLVNTKWSEGKKKRSASGYRVGIGITRHTITAEEKSFYPETATRSFKVQTPNKPDYFFHFADKFKVQEPDDAKQIARNRANRFFKLKNNY